MLVISLVDNAGIGTGDAAADIFLLLQYDSIQGIAAETAGSKAPQDTGTYDQYIAGSLHERSSFTSEQEYFHFCSLVHAFQVPGDADIPISTGKDRHYAGFGMKGRGI